MPIYMEPISSIVAQINHGHITPAAVVPTGHRAVYEPSNIIERNRMIACEQVAADGHYVAEQLDNLGVTPDYQFDTSQVGVLSLARNMRDYRRRVWLMRTNDRHNLSANRQYEEHGKEPARPQPGQPPKERVYLGGAGLALRADGRFAMWNTGSTKAHNLEVRQFDVRPDRLVIASWMDYGVQFRSLRTLEDHTRAIRWNLGRVLAERRGFNPNP